MNDLLRGEVPGLTERTPTSPQWHEFFGKAYRSLQVIYQSHRQQKTPFLPREKIEQIQQARIRTIISHAYHTVPYYRSAMDKLGLKPFDFQSAQDLAKLPLLSKAEFLRNPRLFTSTAIDPSRCLALKSSGTTGLQAAVIHDQNAILLNLAYAGRELEIFTRFIGKSLIRLRVVTLTPPSGLTRTLRWFYRSKTFIPFRQAFLSIFDPLEQNLSFINRFKPHIIMGYGSYLGVLFQKVFERKVTLHRPKVVVYISDRLPEHVQSLMEKELGIPVFSCYGTAEAPRIGFTCEQRKGFHIHSDLCHVAVLNNQGTKGEIVVSNLTNKAMVLLNYRLGDIVSLSDRPCPCGRNFPLIKEVVGRSDDIILFPDGRFINPSLVYEVFRSRMDVLDFQILRYENECYVIKAIPYKASDFRQTEKDLLGEFKKLFGKDARITVERVDSIPSLPNGKVKRVRDLSSVARMLSGVKSPTRRQ